jgi:hypothetical protein
MNNEADMKQTVARRLYDIADKIDWTHLTIPQRQKYYEIWTNDPQIGGVLRQVMEVSRIRVYLKDTIMRTYSRQQRPTILTLLSSMSISCNHIVREYVKPQAILCDKNKLYTLAAAKEWKIAIMSAFERGCEVRTTSKNIVFFNDHVTGRFVDKEYKDLIEAAAKRLDIEVQWLT